MMRRLGAIAMAILIFAAMGISANAGHEITQETSVPEYKSFSDLNGKTVSMLTGAPFEDVVKSKVPKVGEITYYSAMPDMLLAVETGKSDACFMNNAVAELAANRDPDIAVFPENLGESTFGIAFAKGDQRYEKWQAAYETIPEETKKALWEKWVGADDSVKKLPEQDWPGTAGEVTVAACDALEPMSYAGEGGEIIGFDIEMILLMARELDVHVNVTGMEFAAVLTSVESGKADLGCGSIVVTDERKEAVNFVEYYPAAYVLNVRTAEKSAESASPQDRIRDSFNKTFIRENRWKLFLSGIGVTMLITALSVLLGTILGFLVYMLCRTGNVVANTVTDIAVWLVQATPMVVLLLILYYIIFKNVKVDGIFVSVIGFTMTFGAAVLGMFRVGVGAVDSGQMEAALALGYSDHRAFFRMVLPQAIPHMLPVYYSSIVTLIKNSAIVGFIAVQDLTRVGDIVRARTYEAFFPLSAVAIIYFIMISAFTFAVKRLTARLDWTKRSKSQILRGVDKHD